MSRAVQIAVSAPRASAHPMAEKPAARPKELLWLVGKARQLGSKGWRLSGYASALAALSVATLVRLLLDPVLEYRAPYGVYLIAVLVVAWRAGLGPALFTVFGGTLLGRFLFEMPRGSLTFGTETSQASLFMSLTIGIVAAVLCESLRLTASDNRRLYDQARLADARKTEFLASLAHELRNPLTPIQNATYLLESIDDRSPRVIELHQLIGRHTNHLIRLVNDLLDMSRITQGKFQLQCERVELRTIVAGAIDVVRPLIDAKRQTFDISLPARHVEVQADGVRLTQVLTNLLQNAAKYTPEEGRVWLSAEVDRDWLVIRVRDSGIGIAPEMLGHIFNLFEQVPKSIEHSQGGLGIGLTLVRSLVELHGGTIAATSAGLGLGSEFVVRLPGVLAEIPTRSAVPADTHAVGSASAGPLRVLVVDDSPAITRSLEMILTEWKHVVMTRPDGRAALAAIPVFRPDVILADLGMPGMNGYQFAEEVRRLPDASRIELVAISGYGEEADKQRSRAVGFSEHLVKPVDLNELRQTLARHVPR